METTAEKNQITGILSLPQFLYVLSWVIERKHQRPHPQLQGLWIQAIFLLSEHNLGHLLLWLSTNSCISDKNKKESKISSIAYIFRKSTHSSFFSCLLAGCGTWKVVCNVLSFLLSTGVEQAFMIFLGSGLFFYSFICLHYEIVTVFVRVGQKSSAFSSLSVFWYDLYRTGHIFYLLLHEFEQFFLNCSW